MNARQILFGLVAMGILCVVGPGQNTGLAQKKMMNPKMKALVERGKYLVNLGGCNDCHTPKVFGPKGPMFDTTKTLSGHPAEQKLPEIPKGVLAPDQWGALTSNDFTAWTGPWGVSFTRNLTPDVATGIGSWNEAIFVKALRTGKHMGEGRDILPPMPWQNIGQVNDADLKAIFAYLQSLKPIENAVPDPISPTGESVPTPVSPKK
jgi:mono/diheme cytochrome c family protein